MQKSETGPNLSCFTLNSCERYELNVGDEIECHNRLTSCAIQNDVTHDTNDVTQDITHACDDSDENTTEIGTKEKKEEFTDIRHGKVFLLAFHQE